MSSMREQQTTCEVLTVAGILLIALISPYTDLEPVARLHLQDALLAATVVCGLTVLWRRHGFRNMLVRIPLPAIGVFCVSVASLVNVINFPMGARKASEIGLFILLFIVAGLCLTRNDQRRWLVGAMSISGVVVLGMGMWQLIQGNVTPVALFPNRNVFCGFVSGTIFILIAPSLSLGRYAGGAIMILGFAAAFLLLPASGWIGMAAGLLVLWVMRGKRILALFGSLAAAVGVLLSRSLFASHFHRQLANLTLVDPNGLDVSQRYLEWSAALRMLADNCVLGVGAGNYQLNIGKYFGMLPKNNTLEIDAQSGWLVIGATLGIAGLFMLVCLFVEVVQRERMHLRDGRDLASAGLVAAIVAWGVVNMFTPILRRETGPLVMLTLGLLWRGGRTISGTHEDEIGSECDDGGDTQFFRYSFGRKSLEPEK